MKRDFEATLSDGSKFTIKARSTESAVQIAGRRLIDGSAELVSLYETSGPCKGGGIHWNGQHWVAILAAPSNYPSKGFNSDKFF